MQVKSVTALAWALAAALPANEAQAACSALRFSPGSFPSAGGVETSLVGTFEDDTTYFVEIFNIENEAEVAARAEATATAGGITFDVNPGISTGAVVGAKVYPTATGGSPECELRSVPGFAHGPLSISDIQATDGSVAGNLYNAEGKTQLWLTVSNIFPARSEDVRVKFNTKAAGLGEEIVTGAVVGSGGDLRVEVTTPAVQKPIDWKLACTDQSNIVRGAENGCVEDILVDVSVSLDGGKSFSSNSVELTFGYIRPLKVAFMYVGPVDDFGWTYQLNEGRVLLEEFYGGTVDASTYFENIPEGEFEAQPSRGETIEKGVQVTEMLPDGKGGLRENLYFPGFELMKQLCDDDYDLVFTGSFGFQTQALDVSSHYEGCRVRGSSGSQVHNTFFVGAGSENISPRLRNGFGKIYQARYLTGLVAGNELKRRAAAREATGSTGKPLCVGYIAAFPLPEVQRGINAFMLGCREEFDECEVKVAFMGTFHDAAIELDAAKFFWHEEGCEVITQHSDTVDPQKFYSAQQGAGLGYNSDARRLVGDSILLSAILNWAPTFSFFIEQVRTGAWDPSVSAPTSETKAWLGLDKQAVKIADYFSPKVPSDVQERVRRRRDALTVLEGDEAFHDIFCGDMKKRWVYRKASDGTRVKGCSGQAEWVRLGDNELESINKKHFWTKEGGRLGANDPITDTDCLTGIDYAGQALRESAFPSPFNEDKVFNDYFLDGVELVAPRKTLYGTIHDTTSGCGVGFGLGDRFYEPPTDYPVCDGTQWSYARGTCDVSTLTTSIVYNWTLDENNNTAVCGDTRDATGRYTSMADLPFVPIEEGPPCDHVAWNSGPSTAVISIAVIGAIFNAGIAILLIIYRKHTSVKVTQPLLVILMSSGAVLLNLSTITFLGEADETTCLLRIWTFNICFDLVFAFLWSKVYRVRTLFQSALKMKKVIVRDTDMVRMALAIVTFDAIILIVWTIADPPMPTSRDVSWEIPAGQGQLTNVECTSTSGIFMSATLTFKVLLILTACFLVWSSQKVPKQYVEHKYIIFAAYNTAVFAGVVLLLTLSTNVDPATSMLIHAGGVAVGTALINGSLALPRLVIATGLMSLPATSSSTGPHTTASRTGTNPKIHYGTEDDSSFYRTELGTEFDERAFQEPSGL